MVSICLIISKDNLDHWDKVVFARFPHCSYYFSFSVVYLLEGNYCFLNSDVYMCAWDT